MLVHPPLSAYRTTGSVHHKIIVSLLVSRLTLYDSLSVWQETSIWYNSIGNTFCLSVERNKSHIHFILVLPSVRSMHSTFSMIQIISFQQTNFHPSNLTSSPLSAHTRTDIQNFILTYNNVMDMTRVLTCLSVSPMGFCSSYMRSSVVHMLLYTHLMYYAHALAVRIINSVTGFAYHNQIVWKERKSPTWIHCVIRASRDESSHTKCAHLHNRWEDVFEYFVL